MMCDHECNCEYCGYEGPEPERSPEEIAQSDAAWNAMLAAQRAKLEARAAEWASKPPLRASVLAFEVDASARNAVEGHS